MKRQRKEEEKDPRIFMWINKHRRRKVVPDKTLKKEKQEVWKIRST